MASPSLSPSFFNPIVTPEEFKIFHSIDRSLYTRLVLNLGRDPAESMQVMALWIWLERAGHVDDLVEKMLSLPDTLINSLVEEAILCLNCIENDQFHFSSDTNDVPLIHSLTKTGLSLRFFHASRLSCLRAVTKIVNDVCARAFEDILRQSMENKEVVEGQEMKALGFYGPVINPVLPVIYYNGAAGACGQLGSSQYMGKSGVLHAIDPFDLAVQRQFLNTEIADALKSMQISCSGDDQEQEGVPEDNRTIFLTFSKGYPISEERVRDFFTRKHGDCIETIYMQEVPADQQPLYARLVLHTPTIIQQVLEGQSKAKFTIDGKHVWARKYVRKNPKSSSPSHSSSSSPQPTSPAAPMIPILN